MNRRGPHKALLCFTIRPAWLFAVSLFSLCRRFRGREPFTATKRPQQRHAAIAHPFGDACPGAPGKGEDQRTILPSLNLTV